MPTIPTPIWLKKQNLTQDLYDIVKPRMGLDSTTNNGMLRAVAKEVIQGGYRRVESSNVKDDYMVLHEELYEYVKPRVSVWVQTNQDANLQKVLHEILQVGYRKTIKAE